MHNVSKSHESDILRDIFAYKGLLIGSPTYNNKLYPAVESLLSGLQNRYLKTVSLAALAASPGPTLLPNN